MSSVHATLSTFVGASSAQTELTSGVLPIIPFLNNLSTDGLSFTRFACMRARTPCQIFTIFQMMTMDSMSRELAFQDAHSYSRDTLPPQILGDNPL